MEVVGRRQVLGEEELGAGNALTKSFMDNLNLSRSVRAVLSTVEDPCALAQWLRRRSAPDLGPRERSMSRCIFQAGSGIAKVGLRTARNGQLLDDVSQLRDIPQDALLGKRSNGVDNLLEVLVIWEGNAVRRVLCRWHEV